MNILIGDEMGKSFTYHFLFIMLPLSIGMYIQIDNIFSSNNLREGIRKVNGVFKFTDRFYVE